MLSIVLTVKIKTNVDYSLAANCINAAIRRLKIFRILFVKSNAIYTCENAWNHVFEILLCQYFTVCETFGIQYKGNNNKPLSFNLTPTQKWSDNLRTICVTNITSLEILKQDINYKIIYFICQLPTSQNKI